MIDVHCHLNFKAFANDYDEVIKKAFADGVRTIINVGTKIDTSQRAVELANQYENLYAIVGVHPHHADSPRTNAPRERKAESLRHEESSVLGKPEPNYIEELEKLAKEPKVVAIGEIGMDYYRYKSNGIVDPSLQKKIFVEQIKLAHTLKLPLQIHNRHAGEDILKVLDEHKSLLLSKNPGMFHCFAGAIEVLKQVLELGFYVGFDGNITYEGLAPGETVELKKLVEYTPLERIVTETDSPYLAPKPHRGSRNEPKYGILVGQEIARIKGIPFEKVQEQTVLNAKTLFNI